MQTVLPDSGSPTPARPVFVPGVWDFFDTAEKAIAELRSLVVSGDPSKSLLRLAFMAAGSEVLVCMSDTHGPKADGRIESNVVQVIGDGSERTRVIVGMFQMGFDRHLGLNDGNNHKLGKVAAVLSLAATRRKAYAMLGCAAPAAYPTECGYIVEVDGVVQCYCVMPNVSAIIPLGRDMSQIVIGGMLHIVSNAAIFRAIVDGVGLVVSPDDGFVLQNGDLIAISLTVNGRPTAGVSRGRLLLALNDRGQVIDRQDLSDCFTDETEEVPMTICVFGQDSDEAVLAGVTGDGTGYVIVTARLTLDNASRA